MEENMPNTVAETKSPKGPKIVGGIAVVAILGALVAWFVGKPAKNAMAPTDDANAPKKAGNAMEKAEDTVTAEPQEDDAMMKPESEGDSMTVPKEGAMMGNPYKDGTYSAMGAYTSPAGPESIDVTLTIKDGAVTNVVYKGNAENEKSKFMQGKFGDGVSTAVVGKSIDSLDLTVVNGSSLTPKGFMDALEKIKAEAKA